MAAYKIEKNAVTINGTAATLLRVGFGDPAQNDVIVREVEVSLTEMKSSGLGGQLVLINGPVSLPVLVVLSHHLAHQFAAVGMFDPKMAGYVVAVNHGSPWKVGDFIPNADVK